MSSRSSCLISLASSHDYLSPLMPHAYSELRAEEFDALPPETRAGISDTRCTATHASSLMPRHSCLMPPHPSALSTRHSALSRVILNAMPRDLPLSNGNVMINFDDDYNIRDVYYPHVGQDNQTVGDRSRFGVWCDGAFAWIDSPVWQKQLDYEETTLVTRVTARAPSLGLAMEIGDAIDFDRDLFVRRVEIRNLRETARAARVYMHLDPHLWGHAIGDTI